MTIVLAALMANLPDADFLPGYLVGDPRAFHRYALHSIPAAVLAGAVAGACFWRRRGWFVSYWAVMTLIYASHVLLDLFEADAAYPIGVQLLWPFTERFLCPVGPSSCRSKRTTPVQGCFAACWSGRICGAWPGNFLSSGRWSW